MTDMGSRGNHPDFFFVQKAVAHLATSPGQLLSLTGANIQGDSKRMHQLLAVVQNTVRRT
jgi:hypothetical protein